MASKLGLFNSALIEAGHQTLTDTGEAIEVGRVLNQVYTRVIDDVLEEASWNFAMETVKLTADTGVEPNFSSYTEVFAKPSDWVRTIDISTDEDFSSNLTSFDDDANLFAANTSPIYLRYVSNDTGLGYELTRWPASFTRYVELELASRIFNRVPGSSGDVDRIERRRNEARRNAKSKDAMNESQPKFTPTGSWNASRGGRLANAKRRIIASIS